MDSPNIKQEQTVRSDIAMKKVMKKVNNNYSCHKLQESMKLLLI